MFVLLAANVGEEVTSFFAKLDWSNPSWDLFIILFFVIAAFLYGLSLGKDRIIAILVSIYMGLAVVDTIPFLAQKIQELGLNQLFVFKITTFIVIFILLFFLLSRSAIMNTLGKSDRKGPIWQVVLFSFMHVGLLISITLSFLPEESLNNLMPLTRMVFASEGGQFFWIIGPILAMVIARNKKDKDEDK